MHKKIMCLLKRMYNKVFLYPKILKRNNVFKDKYSGERCFILGNGSSLNEMNLSNLKNEYTFVVNCFFAHSQFEEINPSFFSSIEPFSSLNALPKDNYFHPSNYYFKMSECLKGKKVNLFFQIGAKEYIENNHLFLDHEVNYLCSSKGILRSKRLNGDITKPFSFMDGVIYSSIVLAAYMGFKEIFLVGCDFDHILTKSEVHFYKNKEMPKLASASNKELAFNLYTYLSKMEKVKNFLEGKGVKIYNAGIGGMTDTFKRIDFEKIKFK
jgi:hypothetical protein